VLVLPRGHEFFNPTANKETFLNQFVIDSRRGKIQPFGSMKIEMGVLKVQSLLCLVHFVHHFAKTTTDANQT